VTPDGRFTYGVHKPSFTVRNLRENDFITTLGVLPDGSGHLNQNNFPKGDVTESRADWIYEIPNPFPFKGTTYIVKSWAEKKAENPSSIFLPKPSSVSFSTFLTNQFDLKSSNEQTEKAFAELPEPILLTLAETSTDPVDLVHIAELCCEFVHNPETGKPEGLIYQKNDNGTIRANIKNHDLFEVLVNNIHLPDEYKEVMVLKPGVQGESEIVGEWTGNGTDGHVFEYLRRNSYIPWGHYASNMANDSIRYQIKDLSLDDIKGLRHIYYQRTYMRTAEQLGIPVPHRRKTVSEEALEELRMEIKKVLSKEVYGVPLEFNTPLWGWNYGFDFAPSKYRLHASHQQIHQQFAMVPSKVYAEKSGAGSKEISEELLSYGCGDLINIFIMDYQRQTGNSFFKDYLRAIRSNHRLDGRDDRDSSLIVFEDENVVLFVPKAQTSQWELQLMPIEPFGNILDTDLKVRSSLDRGMLIAMKILTEMGARMISAIEYAKRFDMPESDQHVLYCFLPKLPESPGAFSEAQLRWINGHYPEDFAIACRLKLADMSESFLDST
jgi:hypothetical protein